VDSYSISKIGQAREKIKRSFDNSHLLEHDEYVFPRFEMQELTLGEVLGRGGFGTVLEIKGMEMRQHPTEEEEEEKGQFSEKSRVFKIDELDHHDDGHSRRKTSHGLRLRRRRERDHHCSAVAEGDETTLTFSNSHDGCEGLTSLGNDDLTDISQRALQMSKSYDCVDSDDALTPTAATVEGRKHNKRELRSKALSWSNAKAAAHEVSHNAKAAAHDVLGTDEGEKYHKRELRTKALSWHNAKAAAHDVSHNAKAAAHDVSHFFHRSPRNHHDVAEGSVHREIEVALGEEKKDHDEDRDTVNGNDEKKAPEDGERPRGTTRVTKRVSYDDSISPSISESNDGGAPRPAKKRVSRNFSFLAWRDSEAGEEGNDAISPEELEKYNIDPYVSRTFDAILDQKADAEGDSLDAHSDRSSLSAPTTQLTVQTSSLSAPTNQLTVQTSSSSAPTNQLTVPTKARSRGRRVVLKSTPNERVVREPQEEVIPKNNAYYGGYQDKTFITQHATTNEGEARYAIKIISPHIVEDDFKKFLQAAMDMATETYFLSVLDHAHILKLRAVGQGDMFSPSYFLVLDRLYDTLADRIEGTWKQQLDHLENSIIVWNRARKLRVLWEERMSAMKDLAGALNHLHQLKIIYRDIKPENVGFDSRGIVKLFDFGLAKECHEKDECANGTYKLTPNTGSIRYMAPENGNKWPYNFYADSYSFGIMLWEITALERPFASYTPREIRDMVMKWGERPKVKEGWSERVVELMKSAWDSNFRKRPTMEAIEETLEREIEDSQI